MVSLCGSYGEVESCEKVDTWKTCMERHLWKFIERWEDSETVLSKINQTV